MRYWIYIFLFLCSYPSVCQDLIEDSLYYPELEEQRQPLYRQDTVEGKALDSTTWKSLTKDLNYDDQELQQEEKTSLKVKTEDTSWSKLFHLNSRSTKFILFAVVIVLLLYLLFTFLRPYLFSSSPVKRENSPSAGYAIIHDDEQMMQSNLSQLLEEALSKGDFKSAIRISFIQSLQYLQDTHKIQWSKEKTNRSYLEELNTLDVFVPFGAMVSLYEKAWYSEQNTTQEDFVLFKNFRTQLINP